MSPTLVHSVSYLKLLFLRHVLLQLLKSLFGTNLSSQCDEYDAQDEVSSESSDGFYSACFQIPYRHFTDYVMASSGRAHNKDHMQV